VCGAAAVAVVVPGVGGGVAADVGSGTVVVVVGTVAAVVVSDVSWRADQTAAVTTATTTHSNTIRRASTASVCLLDGR
jgi:hypothetical protein